MNPRWRLLPAAALVAPGAAFAVDYMNGDQAQAALFPEADHFEVKSFSLDEPERAAIQKRLNLQIRPKWVVRVAMHGDKVIGAAVVDDVIGKFDRITFAAGVGMDGVVKQVEILSYRESHGQEVRQESWRKEFAGKSAEKASLKVGDDISNISGATLSTTHVADGVRRIAAVISSFQRSGALK
jgi:Na+-translocating ferredoxin:NAD+ oxidoreductase RnfG subunit